MPIRLLSITRVVVVLALLFLCGLAIRPLGGQASPPGRVSFPISLQLGLPQGDFAENVDGAGGFKTRRAF